MVTQRAYKKPQERLLRPGDYIPLPVVVRGYGIIRTQVDWVQFLKWVELLRCECEASKQAYLALLFEPLEDNDGNSSSEHNRSGGLPAGPGR